VSRWVRRRLALVAVWCLPGALSVTQWYVLLDGAHPIAAPWLWLLPWQTYAVLTPAITWLARRFPLEPRSLVRHLPVHVVGTAVGGLLYGAAWLGCAVATGIKSIDDHLGGLLWLMPLKHAFVVVPAYWAVIAVTLLLDYQRKTREAAVAHAEMTTRLTQAQLDSLRMQLHPHFLFNTLNAISVLVRKGDGDRATRMLAGLGELLRVSLESAAVPYVTLGEELAFIDRYLEIEQIRFGDRVRVSRSIATELLAARVPNLLLQPLVENALKHGLEPKVGGGTLEMRADRHGDRLRIEIRDDGLGLGTSHAPGGGIGLSNIRVRLQQLYHDDQSFTLEPAAPGVRVVVEIPYSVTAGEAAS
jgi:two-component system, LytTR family, sensor kinase